MKYLLLPCLALIALACSSCIYFPDDEEQLQEIPTVNNPDITRGRNNNLALPV